MKRFYVYTISLLVGLAASIANAGNDNDTITMKRNVYSATCNYTAPLHTYDRCDENSWIGRVAANCAMDEALDQCEGDYNSDCVKVSVQVTAEASLDFIGYRKCKARARVHGYMIKN